MEVRFRLYSGKMGGLNSTVFDLISGDYETKQTKGLAYVLSRNTRLLSEFLSIPAIKNAVKRELGSSRKVLSNAAVVEVSAERPSKDKKRADIVITVHQPGSSSIAIVIEAKSIRLSSSSNGIEAQLSHYLDREQFPDIKADHRVGVILMRNRHASSRYTVLTWDDIVNLLHRYCSNTIQRDIAHDYLDFIINADTTMRYYETEVLSRPAGRTLHLVNKHFVYACPDEKTYNSKKPLFLALRKSNGGEMEYLYMIEDIVVLNPLREFDIESLKNSTMQADYVNRVLAYIQDDLKSEEPTLTGNSERFHVLSKKPIELINKPKVKKNNSYTTYFSLRDVLAEKEVTPLSQSDEVKEASKKRVSRKRKG